MDIIEATEIYKQWQERYVCLWYTKKGTHHAAFKVFFTKYLSYQIDWELNSPDLNIFISVQSLTQHCFKRICHHLHLFLLIFLILMPDRFLVFPLSLGQVLRESKVSVEVWIFRRRGEWRRTRVKSTKEEKASIWVHSCQPFFINFLGLIFPEIDRTCLFIWRWIFLQPMLSMFFPDIQWHCLKIFSLIIKRALTSLMNRM